GWEGTVVSGDDGTFRIAVPAGRGHLLIHSPASDYVLQEIGSSEIVYGKPGGERYYAHGLVRLDLKPGDDVHDVAVTFRRGARVSGRLIGPDGKPVAQALMISRLNITGLSPEWRGFPEQIHGGRFLLHALDPDRAEPVYFLDAKNKF